MSNYEIFSLFMSGFALLIAVLSMAGTRKLAKQQLEFERVHASLSEKQLAQLEEEKLARTKAQIDVSIASVHGESGFFVVISNAGKGEARDVHFSYQGDTSIAANEIRDKLPIKSLREGKQIRLTADRTYDTAVTFTADVRWKNPDDSFGKDSFTLTL